MKNSKDFVDFAGQGEVENKTYTISSTKLFGQKQFLYIEHDGQKYTLRITRENKLILTK